MEPIEPMAPMEPIEPHPAPGEVQASYAPTLGNPRKDAQAPPVRIRTVIVLPP